MRKLFIILAAVAFAFTFATPAKADVSLSGYIAMETYIVDVDNVAPTKDDSDLWWDLDAGCSRLTVSFKEGPVGGLVEIRPYGASYFRHWWATWDFGAGTLGIGQFWAPEFSCISSALYECGGVTGPAGDPGCTARTPMVQVQFGGLKIAAGKPVLDAVENAPAAWTDTDTSLPKLMVSYNLNVAMVGLKLFGGYQSYEAVNTTTDTTYDVDSYVAGLTATVGVGPLTAKGMVWVGQNPIEYTAFPPISGYRVYWDGTKIVDSDYMSYGVDLAYKVSDTLKVTAGYITGKSERDLPGTWEDETAAYHVNATFTLAKGVTVTPEYAVTDLKDYSDTGTTKAEQAKTTYYGIYWKIAF